MDSAGAANVVLTGHLNDPACFERVSALLDETITARKSKALEYEEYLKRVGEVRG
ncbi:hypothetical protein RP726_05025 [Candidatus Methylospira mobilis]|uniref:hypothetical protein n=1 Tax=Candidatus Methylospira mobilis TaxID=1808979 RepID=UPI001293CC26|nr:hypothetical protein [Candidatus Methylospira mobilis]WNV05785.1 hypothetical protein RP726_05025 [Candidatus Methylospira mobilis]